MSKGLTEIVYILDRSGSMGGLESDTIGGFNSMMEKQKKTGEKAYVSTILFDDECEVLHDREPIDKVGTAHVYESVTKAVCCAMEADSVEVMEGALEEGKWAKAVRDDFVSRGDK
ncbi:MAG: hypothetical protein K5644_09780 [Lachnospiraceae bacterium]|nr:hypothetical protein [Lachnospiraceae bacterium]